MVLRLEAEKMRRHGLRVNGIYASRSRPSKAKLGRQNGKSAKIWTLANVAVISFEARRKDARMLYELDQ